MPAAHDSSHPEQGPAANGILGTDPSRHGADRSKLWGRRPAGDRGESRRYRHRALAGWTALAIIAAAAVLPTHFVVESAGPAMNTIGSVKDTKLLQISGTKTYPTSGALDMTTVYVQGGGQQRLPFFNVLWGWIDPKQDVVPEEIVLPRGTTTTQQSEQNTVMMDDSQQLSTAAALNELNIDFTSHLSVVGFATQQNSGVLKISDRLLSLNGKPITDLATLKNSLKLRAISPAQWASCVMAKP